MRDFNSIKVRLKHRIGNWDGISFQEFQFHKGTIKTYKPSCVPYIDVYFNSIKVRLKLGEQTNLTATLPISIP